MNTEMRPIGVVSAVSLAKIGAAYYALIGALMLVFDAVKGTPVLGAPFGFLVPLLHLTMNLNFHRASWVPGIFSQVFLLTILYTLTGWLSGLACGVVYNFISRHLGMRINGGAD
jgi:hypothetical protein